MKKRKKNRKREDENPQDPILDTHLDITVIVIADNLKFMI